ncbi:ATP-grasp domain-containing protein [Streptomyces triticiradicis]|uniref:ATP-grasp domain-containing protein n=1 Tax=Streptomyces triticiradicis TaxID=2651189 RepID=A0A7J5D3T6_9ACTN|nr:ATP-grasp domain-containing protein [Streptomyces triticiradicis]KAB1978633.1 ATP-grasp domain-containing protein [Streptomyces triticiradicis]
MPTPRRAVVFVGFSGDWTRFLGRMDPDELVIFIEEPDVVRKRKVRDQLASLNCAWQLIEWEHQSPGAADAFVAAFGDLRAVAVVPALEYAVPFAARLAERYGLPGAGLGAALVLRDKSVLRRVSAAAGIANPVSREVRSLEEVRGFVAEHGLPAILKPADLQASLGTYVLTSEAELPTAWEQAHDQSDGSAFLPDRQTVSRMLVETFVKGTEFSVELLVSDGECLFGNVTGKQLFAGPYPVESGHTVPADIPGDVSARLLLATQRLIDALAFRTGFIHAEWIVADGVPYLVEAAGRLAGDMIMPLINHAYDTDMIAAFLDVMRGAPVSVPLPNRPSSRTAVQFVSVDAGKIEEVDGAEEARAVDGVLEAFIFAAPGDEVRELRNSFNRVAFASAAAATTGEALDAVREATDRMVIKIAPLSNDAAAQGSSTE